MPTPSLKFLKTFHLAARHQSFKAAAAELFITPSAVSHQIKMLEDQLGLMLFERGPNSLRLTEAGAHYHEQLDSLFSRIESATEQLRDRFGRNIVRLQAPPFFASELLLPQLNDFSRAHPDIDLQISTRMTPDAQHAADADVSVVVGNGLSPEHRTVRLFAQSFVPACSPQLASQMRIAAAEDLNEQTLIVHDKRPDLWDQWAVQQGLRELHPRQMIRFDSMSAAVNAAESGVGVALVSTPLSTRRFASGSLIKVLSSEIVTGEHYCVVMRDADHERAAVRVLTQWLTGRFGQQQAQSRLA